MSSQTLYPGKVVFRWGGLWTILFQAVVAHFGLLPVNDWQATTLNSLLSVFLSPFPDLAVYSVDALAVS